MHDIATTLDLVRARVLSGAIADLAPLTDRIELLLANLDGLTVAEAEIIRSKANQNTRALAAAMQGVRAAQRRMADLREAATGHRTYGPKGERSAVSGISPTLRQRV
jgi:ElaB/YqjD/DUF883 family membrane-anchored ribosome-binding protein